MSDMSRLKIREEINKLNRMDMSVASYDIINIIVQRITSGMTTVVGRMSGGELFYRVRRTGGVKPSIISEFHAPPGHLISGYQRCNPPNVPMFYAASKRGAAILEARTEVGEIIYLSQWIGNDQLPVNRIFDSAKNKIVDGIKGNEIVGKNDDIIHTYLDTLFTRRIHSDFSDDYKITSAIAQQMTTLFPPGPEFNIHDDGCVCLLYPSVFRPHDSYNTAIQASFAQKRLHLLHVMELKLLSIEGDKITVEVLDNAYDFDGDNIIWTGNRNFVPVPRGEKRSVQFIMTKRGWKLRVRRDDNLDEEYISYLMEE